MKQLFSIQDKILLPQIDRPEKNLQHFICDNWKTLFPKYTFISQEFSLKGTVHPSGSSGRIDILAYDPVAKRFVVFELKKDYDKNVGHQASDYRHYIQRNFPAICLDAIQTHGAELPNKANINSKEVEIVLLAKKFSSLQISPAKTDGLITLIEYNWFGNDLLLLNYVVNAPDTKMKTAKLPGDKPQKWAQDIDRIWQKIQIATAVRENNAKKFPDAKRIMVQEFLREVNKCIASKDAQSLYNAATHPKRPLYIKYAKMILDLEQNVSVANEKGTE